MPPARGLALALALLASGALLACVLAPPTPWTAVEHRPLTLALLASWTLWRLHVLGHAWAQHRAWRHNTSWELEAAALPSLPDDRALAPCCPATRAPRPGRLPGPGLSLAGRADADPGNGPDPAWRPARGRG